MKFASEKMREIVSNHIELYEGIGELPHYEISISDSYIEGLAELRDLAKELDGEVCFVGFGMESDKYKNTTSYMQVVPLRDVSLQGIEEIVKAKLSTGKLRNPHIIYGEIDPKSKETPTYEIEDIADIVAISKHLSEAFGADVDVSGQKINAIGAMTNIRHNETGMKDRVGFLGKCESVQIFGSSGMINN